MEAIIKAGPLLALTEKLSELQQAVCKAVHAGAFDDAAALERQRANLMHELFETDYGLRRDELREIAKALLAEQHEMELLVKQQRAGLLGTSAGLSRSRRSLNVYRDHATERNDR